MKPKAICIACGQPVQPQLAAWLREHLYIRGRGVELLTKTFRSLAKPPRRRAS